MRGRSPESHFHLHLVQKPGVSSASSHSSAQNRSARLHRLLERVVPRPPSSESSERSRAEPRQSRIPIGHLWHRRPNQFPGRRGGIERGQSAECPSAKAWDRPLKSSCSSLVVRQSPLSPCRDLLPGCSGERSSPCARLRGNVTPRIGFSLPAVFIASLRRSLSVPKPTKQNGGQFWRP